jgi:phosphoglucomutase
MPMPTGTSVTPDGGLARSNHSTRPSTYSHRPQWNAMPRLATLVSSSLVDLVAESIGRHLGGSGGIQMVRAGLVSGSVAFGGEVHRASFTVRTTRVDHHHRQDGILLALLASEIIAVTGKSQ